MNTIYRLQECWERTEVAPSPFGDVRIRWFDKYGFSHWFYTETIGE